MLELTILYLKLVPMCYGTYHFSGSSNTAKDVDSDTTCCRIGG